jgi:L-ribulose-5-phosphate 4-epimerase
MSYAELRERVWRANRDLGRSGLVVLSFGNASGADRQAGVMAIKPSGVPYDEQRPESMVVVALEDGRIVEGAELRPSSDTPTHLVLYREFETIGGVVHTHSAFATVWAQSALSIPCLGTTHADHFYGDVPITRQLTREEISGDYEASTGDVIVETLQKLGFDPLEMPAALVASHGPFAWGADPEKAVENAIALETVAQMAFHTRLLDSDVGQIGEDLHRRHFLRKHGANAYYGQGPRE